MSTALALAAPLLSGFAGALATHRLARLAARSRAPVRHGWRRVRPGAMHWTGLVLAGGLVGLMGYVGLFVGSSRPDAARQMQILRGLVAAFAVGGTGCLWQVRAICRADIAWRGTRIAYTGPDGARHERPMQDIAAKAQGALSAPRLTFPDGTVLKLDPYATGVGDLLERIAEARA